MSITSFYAMIIILFVANNFLFINFFFFYFVGSLLVIVCENMDKVVQVDQNEMPFEDVEKEVRPVKRVHN